MTKRSIESNGTWFERLIFASCHSGGDLVNKFKNGRANFQIDVGGIIEDHAGPKYPKTRIGKSLYFMVKSELDHFEIDSGGLLFLSTVNTKADLRHYTDGLFFLPRVPTHPVTLDLFNIGPEDLISLKDFWMETADGESYSETDFQSDLFRYKNGMSGWKRYQRGAGEYFQIEPPDFRQYADRGRPENHFVLTPYDVSTSQRSKEFARLIAGYFSKIVQN